MADPKLYDSAVTILRGIAGGAPGGKRPPAEEAEPAARFPLHWLSDLDSAQAAGMARLWRTLPLEARRDLMGRMQEEARDNFELDFLAVARIALNDPDPQVRIHAIRSFWECEDPRLVDRFLEILERDSDAAVRAAAAAALGVFVERSELEEAAVPFGRRIVARLISVLRGRDDLEVRRRSVESLGYSSEPQVRAILETAYAHPDEGMRASALQAMGRSADGAWGSIVLAEIRSSSPVLRAKAARAAGSLGLRKAVPPLIELLEDVDPGVRAGAIEALGEIGGEAARAALEKAQRQAAGEEWERIEKALENAEFQDSLGRLPLLDLELEEDEDEFTAD